MDQDEVVTAELMLDNGELIYLKCPEYFTDEFFETLRNAIRRGDNYSVLQFDGCKAEYMGLSIEGINTRRVVGFV